MGKVFSAKISIDRKNAQVDQLCQEHIYFYKNEIDANKFYR